jgi:hypothetical protein
MNAPKNSDASPLTNCSPSDYDAGLLNDFGGGDVGWWQDYLRAEIERANDYWREIYELRCDFCGEVPLTDKERKYMEDHGDEIPVENVERTNDFHAEDNQKTDVVDLQCLVRPAFAPGEIVSHIIDENAKGVIVAFMMRGKTHSYEVQWGKDSCTWHIDYELISRPDEGRQIGFWSGLPNANAEASLPLTNQD